MDRMVRSATEPYEDAGTAAGMALPAPPLLPAAAAYRAAIACAWAVTSLGTYESMAITTSATSKYSPLPPMTRTQEVPRAARARILETKGVMGSLSADTSSCGGTGRSGEQRFLV